MLNPLNLLSKIIKSGNQKELDKLKKTVNKINDLEAEVMKFKKPKREMLTIIHTHILSMAVIFFILGGLVSLINLKSGIKKALMIEPLFSVLLTFGGIYLMWLGWHFMRYIVMLSGILMTTSFIISVIIVFFQLFKKKTGKN